MDVDVSKIRGEIIGVSFIVTGVRDCTFPLLLSQCSGTFKVPWFHHNTLVPSQCSVVSNSSFTRS